MDAKSKAEFINPLAEGKTIPCPQCNTENRPDANFCSACGAKLIKTSEKDDTPAFASVSENNRQTTVVKVKDNESKSVFAEGLPNWDILPPQVIVRRR